MGPGDFTTSGHFILLTGVEDGKYQVNDPNRHSTSQKLWDYDTLALRFETCGLFFGVTLLTAGKIRYNSSRRTYSDSIFYAH